VISLLTLFLLGLLLSITHLSIFPLLVLGGLLWAGIPQAGPDLPAEIQTLEESAVRSDAPARAQSKTCYAERDTGDLRSAPCLPD